MSSLLALAASATPGQAQEVGHVVNAGSAAAVDGSYLVVFQEGERPDLADAYGVRVVQRYDAALNGVLVEATAEQAARLAGDPAVRLVEQNTRVTRVASDAAAETSRAAAEQPPSCGLDRIDQPALPLDGSYDYPRHAGRGVDVYLVDTGIDYDHPDLQGRARPGFDAFGGDGSDENGNGTHMAGIIAGAEFGVAKQAELVSVKVLDADGGGTIAGVLDGLDWITEQASGPSVVNFVIGLPVSEALDEAVRTSIAAGITYALEAGADSDDVANASPARVAEGITVGAADCADQVAEFSNHGAGLDLYAPGVDITSDWLGGGTETMSGTHVAASHVSGAAALYLSQHPRATPRQVARALERAAVTDALTGVPNDATPNALLQVPDCR